MPERTTLEEGLVFQDLPTLYVGAAMTRHQRKKVRRRIYHADRTHELAHRIYGLSKWECVVRWIRREH